MHSLEAIHCKNSNTVEREMLRGFFIVNCESFLQVKNLNAIIILRTIIIITLQNVKIVVKNTLWKTANAKNVFFSFCHCAYFLCIIISFISLSFVVVVSAFLTRNYNYDITAQSAKVKKPFLTSPSP